MKAVDIDLIESLRDHHELKLRMSIALEAKPGMSEQDADQLEVIRNCYPHIPIRSVKLNADGVIESHTAAVLEAHSNNPSRGLPELAVDDLDQMVEDYFPSTPLGILPLLLFDEGVSLNEGVLFNEGVF